MVSFATPERTATFREATQASYDIGCDVERAAYGEYGLTRGSRWQVWHPRVLWRYVRLLWGGSKLLIPAKGDDLNQLGGDFVVDADGVIIYAHRSVRPDDRPPADELVALL